MASVRAKMPGEVYHSQDSFLKGIRREATAKAILTTSRSSPPRKSRRSECAAGEGAAPSSGRLFVGEGMGQGF
jgi:hypothetical protein